MKHTLLKFNHGVEIGARLAYLGHHRATNDPHILVIAQEELAHKHAIGGVLKSYNEQPFKPFDMFFIVVGTCVSRLCLISPKFALNFIARVMEMFATTNYRKLATLYPEHQVMFLEMAETEDQHKRYFGG